MLNRYVTLTASRDKANFFRPSPRPPLNTSFVYAYRSPARPVERANDRSRSHLARKPNRNQRCLSGRRLALPGYASTWHISQGFRFPQQLKRRCLGIYSSFPQAHPMAHLLTHATDATTPQDALCRNRIAHRSARVPKRWSLRRYGCLELEEG